MQSWHRTCSLVLVLALFGSTLQAETLTLSSAFVTKVKNKATFPIQLELDTHLTSPHRIGRSGDDGDIHMAGRSDDVQLPMVAEIMNAGLDPQTPTVTDMNGTSSGQMVPVAGVWRIWFEHPSPGDQVQGDPVDVPANTNPDHVFEVHPVTSFDGQDIADTSLVPIANGSQTYQAYPAQTAFGAYDKLTATISATDTAVTITSGKAGYNYAEFIIELAGQPVVSRDDPTDNGVFVLANVYDLSDPETPVTSEVRRMVFVENTEPAKQVLALAKGGRMHVLGVPRVNLADVAALGAVDSVNGALPYEMIIVAVLPDSSAITEPAVAANKPQSAKGHKKHPQNQ